MTAKTLEKLFFATTATVLPSIDNGETLSEASVTPTEDGLYERTQVSVSATADLSVDFDNGWYAEKMRIPGSDAFIRLKRKPIAKLNVSQTVTIPDWGVSVPVSNVSPESLRNAVVRQYVMLADKSRRHALTDEERGVWKHLLADSDYGDFCQRTAPAVRDVATRIRADKNGVEVVWSSGENETVPNDLAKPLAIVEDGEEFSARVKFIDYKLASLSEVVPLGKPAPVGLDDLFGAA
ncbi:MAG: hypothetical protein SOW92_00425 [Kiritimatiellia bacterium]|nr:hypothetical protein [Kiritimatiellia bacterium]